MSLEHQSKLTGTPIAEIEIDLPLVSRLLAAQHPDLAHLPLQWIDAGWDNVMFRLGDRLSVRLPRRQVAAALIEHEQIWLPFGCFSQIRMLVSKQSQAMVLFLRRRCNGRKDGALTSV